MATDMSHVEALQPASAPAALLLDPPPPAQHAYQQHQQTLPQHGQGSSRTSYTHVEQDPTLSSPPSIAPQPSQLLAHEDPGVPQTSLAFLLVSGRRRTMNFDPTTTVGRVKELMWNSWPADWQDERPPAPAYLRILYLGKILQDEDTLAKLKFPSHVPNSGNTDSPSSSPPSPTQGRASSSETPPAVTIVHLSIRPCALPSNEDTPKKRGRGARGPGGGGQNGQGGQGCCTGCVIS